MQSTFLELIATQASAQTIAECAANKWRELEAVLSPIIGQRGVSVLFRRALYLIRSDYPWLVAAHQDVDLNSNFSDFAPLQAALAQQTNQQAGEANLALYYSFNRLLISLIGESLTQRLLQSILEKPLQDPSS